jgi:DNA-binding CsgD family transcriptional regulator
MTERDGAAPALSPGEVACIRLLIEGRSDAEIAGLLNIAPATAHWRIEQAKRKFGVRTRAQLTALAVAAGYVEVCPPRNKPPGAT